VDAVTRRRLLLAGGVTAGAALAGGAALTVRKLLDAGREAPTPADASILVLVTLYGGNDGLNTVIPAGDAAYHQARPGLAYDEDDVLPLSDGLGLHPALKGLKALWQRDRLAVVRGVSYPRPDHGHTRSMGIWQSAVPAGPGATGWLGRWLDATGRDPLRAVAVGPVLPQLLTGQYVSGVTLPVTDLALPAALRTAVAGLARTDGADTGPQARAAAALTELIHAGTALGPSIHPPSPSPTPSTRAAPSGSPSPSRSPSAPAEPPNPLADQLRVVGDCVTGGAPTRAYSVALHGFDTHANQRAAHATLLGQLDAAVAGFLSRVGGTEPGRRVVVVIYSEFGRRVAVNANGGTDHGTAGPVLIAGEPVRGGFYADQPSLTRLNNGDLFASVDFRDVYATLLDRVLTTDPTLIIPDYRPRIFGFV
jgi:uncharacterized protein (DUF1501 family)